MSVAEEDTAQNDQPEEPLHSPVEEAVPGAPSSVAEAEVAEAEGLPVQEATDQEADSGGDDAGKPDEPVPVAQGEDDKKRWYVVKVQSGREESIKDGIERRVKIEGLEGYFGRIVIPIERVSEMVRNKRVVKEKKLFPGYLMVNVEYNDSILYLFRETSGVGDFVGASMNHPPLPMSDKEVEFMIKKLDEPGETPGKVPQSKFDVGDRVKVKDGTFAGMEGEIKEKLEAKGALKVELTIFGRPVPVELEYWQVEYA